MQSYADNGNHYAIHADTTYSQEPVGWVILRAKPFPSDQMLAYPRADIKTTSYGLNNLKMMSAKLPTEHFILCQFVILSRDTIQWSGDTDATCRSQMHSELRSALVDHTNFIWNPEGLRRGTAVLSAQIQRQLWYIIYMMGQELKTVMRIEMEQQKNP